MNNIKEKFYLKCVNCQHITHGFKQWFTQSQSCPLCGSKQSEVNYNSNYEMLFPLLKHKPENFWHYFPFLPLYDRENIITCCEGSIPVENWIILEEIAKKKYGIDCKVFVYRNDLNGGTGTFKDVAAALAASVLKEHHINEYVVASTGNTATSYARYLALAGINCSVFIPDNALKDSEAAISAFGQNVYRVKGDYAKAKSVAAAYAKANDVLISSGNIDPLRVEAKKTMVFEWLRQLGKMPDVYIQAVSGGTGPIAIDKAVRELKGVIHKIFNPRFILIQPDKCPPMALSWEKAKKDGFPYGFEKNYSIIENPQTSVPTLATGIPTTYPIIAKLVQKSKGEIIQVNESQLAAFARLIAFEMKVLLGPASAVGVAGFFKALACKHIKSGETVLLNIGEGVSRASAFVEEISYTSQNIESANECKPHSMKLLREKLWYDVLADK